MDSQPSPPAEATSGGTETPRAPAPDAPGGSGAAPAGVAGPDLAALGEAIRLVDARWREVGQIARRIQDILAELLHQEGEVGRVHGQLLRQMEQRCPPRDDRQAALDRAEADLARRREELARQKAEFAREAAELDTVLKAGLQRQKTEQQSLQLARYNLEEQRREFEARVAEWERVRAATATPSAVPAEARPMPDAARSPMRPADPWRQPAEGNRPPAVRPLAAPTAAEAAASPAPVTWHMRPSTSLLTAATEVELQRLRRQLAADRAALEDELRRLQAAPDPAAVLAAADGSWGTAALDRQCQKLVRLREQLRKARESLERETGRDGRAHPADGPAGSGAG